MKTRPALTLLALGALVTATAFAHVDDPKGNVPHVPVYGNVYHAGEGTVAESFAANGVLLKSWIPINNFATGLTSANDCWGYVSPSGREYAILGTSGGTGFAEITDPAHATVVGHVAGPTSLWRCVKAYGAYCYAGSEGGGGVQVIDMTNIDGTNAGAPRVSLANTVASTAATPATHTLAIDAASGYLYRAGGGSNGLRIYDVKTNPANPTLVGSWSNVYVHECQVVTYTTGPYAGKQIAFCCGGSNGGTVNTGMYILDVTNKGAITQLSYTTYPNARFCHQSWLSADASRIYINDELDEGASVNVTTTYVMNVTNLSAPTVAATFTNGNTAIGHNLYIGAGNKLFEANYHSGLRVFDLNQSATNPPEVAYFDTYPTDDLPEFNGLWNVWPFFPSGAVIGADIERGLFVWKLGAQPGTWAYPNGKPSMLPPAGATVDVQVTGANGVTIPAGAVKLVSTVGANTVSSDMVSLGGNLYRGTFPNFTCGDSVSWNVRIDVNGVQYPDPTGPNMSVAATSSAIAVDDHCEALGAWSLAAAGDTATAGFWVNADPVATAAQPENDHTPNGTNCFITGNGVVGGAIGAADLDGGIASLTTPAFDGSGDCFVNCWVWWSNDMGSAPLEDSMPISISNDNGATWTVMETVADNENAWIQHTWRIKDYVTPSATMKIRFAARDLGAGSIVEAGVDDFQVVRYGCAVPGDFNGDGRVNGADLGTLLGNWGLPGPTDLNGDGTTGGADLGILLGSWTP